MSFDESIFTVTTERLVIRPLVPDDAARMVAFATTNREHLAPWEPLRTDYYFTVNYWLQEIAHAREEMLADRALRMIMLLRAHPEGAVIGRINYNNIVRGVFQATHLGYALDESSQGQGLMSEALAATNQLMFDTLGLHRIMANYMPNNARSGTLLERLGFEKEGLARQYLQIAGRWEDHILTSRLNPADSEPY
jgi:ribosomal-protein-alanine N-acetyltransferase